MAIQKVKMEILEEQTAIRKVKMAIWKEKLVIRKVKMAIQKVKMGQSPIKCVNPAKSYSEIPDLLSKRSGENGVTLPANDVTLGEDGSTVDVNWRSSRWNKDPREENGSFISAKMRMSVES